MPRLNLQVLLALRDTAPFALLVQALMQQETSVALASPQKIEDLLDRLRKESPSLLVLELDSSATLLEQVRAQHPHLPVVVVMGKPTAAISFAASRLGAEDVLTLPLDEAETAERMRAVLEKLARQQKVSPPSVAATVAPEPPSPLAVPPQATEGKSISAPRASSPHSSSPHSSSPQLIGSNPRMAEIRDIVAKVATTDATVLIRGESGVGKEIVARMVYEASRRVQKPFIKVNCAAIPNDLLESELFGYDVGAFTGATRPKPGKFELADHGTLFLDEIGEMHPLLQAKLLHVLQDGQFSRLGAKHDLSVDVRVLCATNKLLEQRVAEGLFREDLYYRINVVTVHVPPLRERRDEIPLLTHYFLEKYAVEYRRPVRFFSAEVERQMLTYGWPGNVRELENLCKRFVIVGGETQILRELSARSSMHRSAAIGEMPDTASLLDASPSDAKDDTRAPSPKRAPRSEEAPSLLEIGRQAAWQAERQAIQQMLQETHWNRKEAARRLGVSYKALLNKMKQMENEKEIQDDVYPEEKKNSH